MKAKCQKCGYEPKGTGPKLQIVNLIIDDGLIKTFYVCEPCVVRIKSAFPPGA